MMSFNNIRATSIPKPKKTYIFIIFSFCY